MDDLEREIASQEEVNLAVCGIFTKDFEIRLYKYGILRLKTVFFWTYDIHKGVGGYLLEDLICETMASFIEGNRKWYKDAFPDFKKQVFSAFDSVISNTIHKLKEIDKSLSLDNLNIQVSIEDEDKYMDMLDFCKSELYKMGANDDEILLFEPYIVHKTKRQVLAEQLGVTEHELTNIKKRLDRKLPTIKEGSRQL